MKKRSLVLLSFLIIPTLGACPLAYKKNGVDRNLSLSVSDESKDRSSYPAAWWQEVPREGAPAWEILPQDAGAGEVILSKRTELGILSNFSETPFTLDAVSYRSVEGFWQMMKYPESSSDPRATFAGLRWPFTRQQVSQMVGFEAKGAGDAATKNMTTMGIDWVTYQGNRMPYHVGVDERGDHYKVIRRAMEQKLAENPEVRRILLATGDLILRPDHDQGANAAPAWRYYEIWMELREQLHSK